MKFELNSLPYLSKDTIAEDIKRVDKLLKKEKLTKKDYLKNGKVGSGTTINKYFTSWHNALEYAGLIDKSNGRIPTEKLLNQKAKELTNEEIISELKNIARKLGTTTLIVEQVDANSENICAATVRNRFGWKEGLQKAGLGVVPHGKKYNDDECFENLLKVWTSLGRQPKISEMKRQPSTVGIKAYISRWGNWFKTLEAFVERVNDDTFDNDEDSNEISNNKETHKIKKKIKDEDKRDIKIGLRYKIFSRDNFKCVICGASPATDNNCRLQIDHIFPFSKGGKTKAENLRTLCNKCNLGKSDKIE